MAIVSQEIEYRDADTPLTGLLFSNPTRTGKRPGLLLVHHGGGLDDHAKTRSHSYAELGFVVFACDLYGPEVRGNREQILALLGEMRSDPAKLCRRAQAGLEVLKAQHQQDGRIAAIGYCFGGMTVLQMARGGAEFRGVVSVHGSLATILPADPGTIKSKILVCHGALDPHVPMPHVTAFADEMTRAGADWQLIMYGGAMHGFTHKTATGMPGVAYDAAADARSGVAIKDFFRELLEPADSWSA